MEKQYTHQQIKALNDQGKLVVLMGQKVLDVTGFKHPGGNDKLTTRSGQDVLEDFVGMKHSTKAESIAKGMVIGSLEQKQAPMASNYLSVGVSFGPSESEPASESTQDTKAKQKVQEDKSQKKKEEEGDQTSESEEKKGPTIIDGVRYIDQEELEQHMEEDDLWLLIDGKVYDCTSFHHPGGKEIMLDHAGDDATQAFEDQNHTELAYDEMKDLYVGDFRGELKKRMKEQGPPGSLKNKLVAVGFMIVIFALFMQYIWLSPDPQV